MKWDEPEVMTVTCTDNDKTAEVTIIRKSHDSIRAELQGIPLNFKKYKPGVYIANMSGIEFVLKTK